MTDAEQRLRNLLHTIANEQQYKDYELHVTPISTEGANYTSTLYVAKVTSKAKEDLHLFIKLSVLSSNIREKFKVSFFDTERFIYSDLRKAYMEIEEKHNLPEKDRLHIAKYYGEDSTPPYEMLVLENLAVKGFLLHDRFKSIDWKYALAAVNEMVKLHSLSIAYQREYPKEFKHFTENYMFQWQKELTEKMLKKSFEQTIAVAPEEHKGKLKKLFDQYNIETMLSQYAPLKVKVLAHSDYRPSNLMYRTLDDGSLELIALDHQTIQVGSPVIDLLYLIFTGTDKQFRDQYYDKLVDHYYTQLSEAMKRLDIDPEITYSRADFDFEMKEKMPFGLTVAAFTLPIITVESQDAPAMKEDIEDFVVEKTGRVFPERINGIIEDYVRWGVLKD